MNYLTDDNDELVNGIVVLLILLMLLLLLFCDGTQRFTSASIINIFGRHVGECKKSAST